MAALEAENAGLLELVEERERQLEQLTGRLETLEAAQQDADDGGTVGAEDERGGLGAQRRRWWLSGGSW